MSQRFLRIIRIVVSIAFLVSVSALFVDYREFIPTAWSDNILFLQFVPSVIKFLTVATLASTGFFIVLLLTVLFGRVYCSTICPLGILQDVFAWLSKKTRLIKRYKYKKALDYLRYPVFAITVLLLLFGSLYLVNLLDPYSSFGRIFSDLVRPGVVAINNGLASQLEKHDIYFIFRLDLRLFTWRTIFIPIVTLALVVWLSLKYGRLYCNTVCPVGTLLGLLSRISLFRIKMDPVSCTKCGKCSFACKSFCIDVKNLKVDFSRCVACYNCISSCPSDSIKYKLSPKLNAKSPVTDTSKRDFINQSFLYLAALAGISARSHQAKESKYTEAGLISIKKQYPVSPPGSISLYHFKDRCTACHLCVTACPTRVLQPSFLEYGFIGMMQPHMNYAVEYCNYDCTICGEVCPTGAILPLTLEDKKLTQTGVVHFIIEKCIVYTDNTSCGSCSEHCPTQAVKMVPYKDELTIPQTQTDICIGCGACEYACPVKPYVAIFVDGNLYHQVAKAPKIEELKVETQEEFPF
jgi:ferredoxin